MSQRRSSLLGSYNKETPLQSFCCVGERDCVSIVSELSKNLRPGFDEPANSSSKLRQTLTESQVFEAPDGMD